VRVHSNHAARKESGMNDERRTSRLLTRRRFLAAISAAGILATERIIAACAPDAQTPPEAAAASPPFHFVAMNDTHVLDERCAAYLRKAIVAIRAIARETPIDFVIHAGDITTETEIGECELFRLLMKEFGLPVYVVPGNHDYAAPDRDRYERFFPKMTNYRFEHKGWHFIGFDSTEGTKSALVTVSAATLKFLAGELERIDVAKPVVGFTHLPFGTDIIYRPVNADAVLNLFAAHKLAGIISGHFHGHTERRWRNALLTTSRCLSVSRDNHDGTKQKGFLLFTAANEKLTYRFVEVPP
jgi:3',5'-cyclic AMP phosphodiesterase CpdA